MVEAQQSEATATPGSSRPVIVVGYSSKPEGRAALKQGVAEAELRKADLIVVHTSVDVAVADLHAELEATGLPYEVKEAADALDPAEELISTAEERGAEFIIIGLRRRSPVGKLLLGSNAQRVLLDAACPVLAVKAEAPSATAD
jgi:nucleotide-binding universal stress UspA family protein